MSENAMTAEEALALVQKEGRDLCLVPEAMRTEALCRTAMEADPSAFAFVPDEIKTPEMCSWAVEKDCLNCFPHVPESIKTRELCEKACGLNPWSLQYVPEKMLDEALALPAVEREPELIRVLPKQARTLLVCAEAALHGAKWLKWAPAPLRDKARDAADFVIAFRDGTGDRLPEELADPAFCLWSAGKCGYAVSAFPRAMCTPEVCEVACLSRPEALRDVPAESKTEAMCRQVFADRPDLVELIPPRLRTPEMHDRAIADDGLALRAVPMELRTQDRCLAAVWKTPVALQYVPEKLRAGAIARRAVQQDVRMLELLPEAERTEALCLHAVSHRGDMLQFVPECLRTEALCLEAVKRDGAALEFVPEALRTSELCEAAGVRGFPFVPDALKTEAMCLDAVSCDGLMLKFVPEALRTDAVCLEAVDREPAAVAWLPGRQEAPREEIEAEAGSASEGLADAVCRHFRERCAEAFPLPSGCALELVVKRLDDGRTGCKVYVPDPDGRFYSGKAPCAFAVYKPGRDGSPLEPETALADFAGRLAGSAGKPVKGMPEKMAAFCAEALGEALAMASDEEPEDDGGPRP